MLGRVLIAVTLIAVSTPAWAQSQPVPQATLRSAKPLEQRTALLHAITGQFERCWSFPAGARTAGVLPEFSVQMRSDGTVAAAQLLNPEQLDDPSFKVAAESANRALHNPQCQPLKLPPYTYDQWQSFTVTFDPKDLM